MNPRIVQNLTSSATIRFWRTAPFNLLRTCVMHVLVHVSSAGIRVCKHISVVCEKYCVTHKCFTTCQTLSVGGGGGQTYSETVLHMIAITCTWNTCGHRMQEKPAEHKSFRSLRPYRNACSILHACLAATRKGLLNKVTLFVAKSATRHLVSYTTLRRAAQPTSPDLVKPCKEKVGFCVPPCCHIALRWSLAWLQTRKASVTWNCATARQA